MPLFRRPLVRGVEGPIRTGIDKLRNEEYTFSSFVPRLVSSPPVFRSDHDGLSGNPGGDVKNLLLTLFERKLSQNTIWKLFAIGLCVYALVIAGYDVWVHFHPAGSSKPLYLMPFESLAFAGVCEWNRRRDAKKSSLPNRSRH